MLRLCGIRLKFGRRIRDQSYSVSAICIRYHWWGININWEECVNQPSYAPCFSSTCEPRVIPLLGTWKQVILGKKPNIRRHDHIVSNSSRNLSSQEEQMDEPCDQPRHSCVASLTAASARERYSEQSFKSPSIPSLGVSRTNDDTNVSTCMISPMWYMREVSRGSWTMVEESVFDAIIG